MIDWSGYLGLILHGAVVTLQLTLMGSALAVVMAFLGGLGRLSRFFAVRALATAYIEFFRGTSIFVQLFWAYFVLPVMGVTLTPMQTGVLALAVDDDRLGSRQGVDQDHRRPVRCPQLVDDDLGEGADVVRRQLRLTAAHVVVGVPAVGALPGIGVGPCGPRGRLGVGAGDPGSLQPVARGELRARLEAWRSSAAAASSAALRSTATRRRLRSCGRRARSRGGLGRRAPLR